MGRTGFDSETQYGFIQLHQKHTGRLPEEMKNAEMF